MKRGKITSRRVRQMNFKASKLTAAPYILWVLIFIIVPLALIAVFAFTTTVKVDGEGNILSAEEISVMEEELAVYNEENGTEEELELDERTVFTLDNIIKVNDYLPVLFKSLWLAAIATAICLVIAYPMSFAISRVNANKQKVMIMLIMLPMWMNFLLRTYAWMTLLEKNGWINKLLSFFNIGPFQMINTQGAVVLGMVYNYLPFMILPLYSIMVKIHDTTLEASSDLGANVFQTFSRVVLPLSMPGIASGITMVFVPAISTFIISRMLGGGTNLLIGDLIDLQFLGNAYNPNLGAAISLVLMAFILLCMSITNQLDNEDNIEGVLL
jgi:spermidine/putrescine transport system permease protein